MTKELIDGLTQFGVAGLMGVLWMWERMNSRKRERQLSEAHETLISDREHLEVLVTLVKQNTAAVERFDRTQTQLIELLERVSNDHKSQAA